jgi:NADH-quinone oxidoreductase subunit E
MLSADSLKKIDAALTKYPGEQKRSAIMAALTIAQDEKGWLAPETIDFVAHYLGIPSIAAYEVATFYTMYNTEPVGKYKVSICTNLPCALSGAVKSANHLKQKLGIDFNETTADGKITLKEGECFGACGDAPVFLLNNKKMCSFMTPEEIDKFLAGLK